MKSKGFEIKTQNPSDVEVFEYVDQAIDYVVTHENEYEPSLYKTILSLYVALVDSVAEIKEFRDDDDRSWFERGRASLLALMLCMHTPMTPFGVESNQA